VHVDIEVRRRRRRRRSRKRRAQVDREITWGTSCAVLCCADKKDLS